ncbi:hypothetical protein ERO13_D07G068650v2 [Gossypium hirsutum]|nr:hypothetical protein ERO13_D07G068650v2 [Gossypium hirsutum]
MRWPEKVVMADSGMVVFGASGQVGKWGIIRYELSIELFLEITLSINSFGSYLFILAGYK